MITVLQDQLSDTIEKNESSELELNHKIEILAEENAALSNEVRVLRKESTKRKKMLANHQDSWSHHPTQLRIKPTNKLITNFLTLNRLRYKSTLVGIWEIS